jgi:hypothetical protein
MKPTLYMSRCDRSALTTFSFPALDGGTHNYELPTVRATLGYWVKPSPIPDTPEWEWVVTNIPADLFPGLVNGYADTEADANRAVRAALSFWRARGYATAKAP